MEQAKLTDRATVHVIDDDESPRKALSLLFPSVGLGVRTYASVHEFVDAGAHDGLGCIVLDVRLPGISGLDFQSRRDEFGVHLPIVLMTGHSDVPMSVRAMKAGAIDFLTKPWKDEDLLQAVRQALEQDRQRRKVRAELMELEGRLATLTPREREVLPLVACGLLNKQAAARLGISEVTLQIHRSRMMQKMKANSLADLVRMAAKLDIGEQHLAGGSPP
jgi:FixJ family two-component response regulator